MHFPPAFSSPLHHLFFLNIKTTLLSPATQQFPPWFVVPQQPANQSPAPLFSPQRGSARSVTRHYGSQPVYTRVKLTEFYFRYGGLDIIAWKEFPLLLLIYVDTTNKINAF